MSIKVSQAFERTSIAPIDETLALTKAQMVTVADTMMPAYYFTICQDDGKIYLYDKTATPSASTGKFTEFSGGGSSDVKFFTTTNTLSKDINGTKVVAAADLPGVTWSDLVVGSSVIKDAKGTMGLVTAITGTTSVTVTTATTSTPTVELTQAEYDALATKDPDTIYFITDVEGGGGGGGHTILNTDGTAMAQEDSLQFIGLDVTDNSTDGVTEVESAGLNSDSIDDITNGSIGNEVISNGLVYSTNEQVVGKWIDGKPIYQKTFSVTQNFAPNTMTAIATISGIETPISCEGNGVYGNSSPRTLPNGDNHSSVRAYVTVEDGKVYFISIGYANNWTSTNITVKYTKTTN